jgi:glucokinase
MTGPQPPPAPEAAWILGFDVGGTKTAAIAGSLTGQVLDRAVFASRPERGFEAMWADLVAAGRTLIAARGQPAAIGVSIGGPLDSARGIILSPLNLPGWDAIPLKDRLQDAFGVPAYIEHDAKACALAEWMFGAARGYTQVVFLTFGTGLGAGLILDGRLYRGGTDQAGEVGHWRIAADGPLVYAKRGSWEGYSSGAGLAALAIYQYPGAFPPDVTAADIIAQARAGEDRARALITLSATMLGQGIALLIDLLNPEVVVLGSLAVRAGDLYLPIVRQVAAAEARPEAAQACVILPAALGDQLGDVAALCAALYHGRIGPGAGA